MRRHRLLVLGMVCSIAGCNMAPAYHIPLASLPGSYKEAGQWQTVQPQDSLSRGPWWQRFNDPTLNRLVPELENSNPDLAAAVARYDQARAFAAEAEAGLYPQVFAAATFSENSPSANRPLRGTTQPSTFGANQIAGAAQYEIDLWGQLRNEASAGKSLAQASAADLATMNLSLEAELASDYFVLRGLDADDKLLTDTVDAFQRALDLTENLLAGKLASGADVSRAQTQIDMARAMVSDIVSRRALMEHAIASLVGEPATSFSLPPQIIPFDLPAIPTGMPATLLQRRPDIASAERMMNAANAQVGIARAAYYPALTLTALGGFQSTDLNLLSLPNSVWSIGPNLQLPLFEGGRLHAQEAAAYGRYRETTASYRSTVLTALQQVEDNLALLHWLGQESVDEEAGVKAAQHTLDIALNLYKQGITSYLEVVTAQTALLQAQQSSIDLQARRLTADVGLIRALGGGWDTSQLPTTAETLKLPAAKT
ncbi:MAG TPA: efflux transporter outer membrane subunit [Acetobacteraceae bacterium]